MLAAVAAFVFAENMTSVKFVDFCIPAPKLKVLLSKYLALISAFGLVIESNSLFGSFFKILLFVICMR